MPGHADILDRPDSLRKPFWTSIILHISCAAAVLLAVKIEQGNHFLVGSPTGGGPGAVMVNPVSTIPLPSHSGIKNPVANDTESQVPEAPKPQVKVQPKAKAPEPDAIALKGRNAKSQKEPVAPRNTWREQQKDLPGQLYSTNGSRVNTDMYQIPGGGGVGVGDNSPFGQQFGWYANELRNQVAGKWKTSDLDQRVPQTAPAVVTFTVSKDGAVSNLRIAQTSGNPALDFSAKRAVLDASPLPALPPGFPKTSADVELKFELRH
jgi:protein TonB